MHVVRSDHFPYEKFSNLEAGLVPPRRYHTATKDFLIVKAISGISQPWTTPLPDIRRKGRKKAETSTTTRVIPLRPPCAHHAFRPLDQVQGKRIIVDRPSHVSAHKCWRASVRRQHGRNSKSQRLAPAKRCDFRGHQSGQPPLAPVVVRKAKPSLYALWSGQPTYYDD